MSDWDDWRFALALARAAIFSRAADELGVDVSTVQRRIKRLEQKLDVQLFERDGIRYTPTAAGAPLIHAAESMEAAVLRAERETGNPYSPTGSLRITISEDLMESPLGPYFANFCRTYPGIDLNLVIDPRDLGVQRYDMDAAIQTVRPSNEEDEAVGHRICTVAWSCYAHRNYLPEGSRRPKTSDLSNHAVLAPLFRPRVRRWLQELRPHVHPNIRSTSLLTLRRFAKEKMGVAVLPCYLGDTEPSLKPWFPPIKDLADELWIVSDIQVRETARVRAFFEHMENLTPAECDLLEGRQLRPRIRTRTRSRS